MREKNGKNKQLLLLSYLRENSRDKLTSISKKTNLPISTLYDTLKQLENSLIIKHTSLIDFFQLGYKTHAQVLIHVDQDFRDKLKQFLLCHQQINNVYKTGHKFHFIAECVFQSMRELDDFIENLERKFSINDYRVNHLVEEIKREEFLVGTVN